MSHHTGIGAAGTPSGTTHASGINVQNNIWYDVPNPPSGGMYVDGLHFYCGGGDAGILGGHTNAISSHLWMGHWQGSNHSIDIESGAFSAANGEAWQDRTGLTPTFINNTLLSVGWWSDPSTFRQWVTGGGGAWNYEFDSSWPANAGSGTSSSGTPGAYYDYWDPCSISSITSTTVAPGQSFSINGTSFSATITGIDVNGTTVTTYTVNSDGLITATVPNGATTGPVHVRTNVGNATSPTNLNISSLYINTGTPASPVWTPCSGVFVNTGTPASPVWTQVGGIFVNTGTPASPIWTPGG